MTARSDYPLKDGGPVRIGLWWLFGLFLLALAIRCIGLLWGGVHADENISDPAKVLTGQLIPSSHYYPPLLNYLTAAGYAVLYAIGIPMRLWRSTAEFRAAFFDNPDPFLLVLRLVVSFTGAVAAPLSAAIAARLGLSRASCLLVGVASALLPISVWRSHIGKQDLGVAASALLAVWAMVRYAQELRRVDVVWFGAAVALAVSFKQSAVFVVAPFGVALLFLARRAGHSWPRLAQDSLIAVAVGIIVWVPLNAGVWLDWSNFLDYQKVLAAMHMQQRGFRDTFEAVGPLLTDRFSGPTLPLLVGFMISPFFWRRLDIFLIWMSTLVSVIVTAAISGNRADVQLYVPVSVLIGTIGIMTWLWMAGRKDWSRWPGMVGLASAFVVLVAGSLEVARQALATPIHSRVAEVLRKVDGIGRRRILATDLQLTGLPVAGNADHDVRERDERLAQRYGVTLGPRVRPYAPEEGRYYIRALPFAMSGLESFEGDLKVVKPFAWPLQPEEWRLDYWLNKGFTVFVIRDEQAFLSPPDRPCSSGSAALGDCYMRVDVYRRLHQDIHDRCTLVAAIPAGRPLFEEADTKVYLSDPL